jgi:hypothetical protein
MSYPPSPEVIQQALAFADGCARADVEILGLELAPGRYALVMEDEGPRARRIEDADFRLQEATAYLLARGLALMRIDAAGPVVVLRCERFDDDAE